MTSLTGKVVIVTGASRGIGKGIALALGGQGAIVYVTRRTIDDGEHELPGTVGETAAEVTRRGGVGIPVRVDHADDIQVAMLFDQVRRERGRLDILVNNAFALPGDLTDPKPFWDKPLSNWEMVDVGVRSNFVAAHHAAQIMVPQRSGLIVAISGYVGVMYTYGVVFGLCKAAVEATDPELMDLSGGTFITAELATRYGITDIDGRTIPSLRAERGSPLWRPVIEAGHGR